MNLSRTLLIFLGFSCAVGAQPPSPDGNYLVEYFESGPAEANVRFKSARTGKILHTTLSAGFGQGTYQQVEWSPDSRYLAVVTRGTKTSSEVELFRFDHDAVTQVDLPDYRLNLLGRRNLVRGGRHHWVENLQWNGAKLRFDCRGQWVDGSGDPLVDPGNWYRFRVTISLSTLRPSLDAVSEIRP